MTAAHVMDTFSIGLLFLIFILLMVGFIEAGFLFGRDQKGKGNKAQMAQVRAIMGASLGLLAFMLAFSFSIAQSHFEARAQAYLMELNAISSAYRSAGMLDDGNEYAARDLIRQVVDSRVELSKAVKENRMDDAKSLILQSDQLESRLWQIAEESSSAAQTDTDAGVFVSSVLAMIDASTQRIQAALYNRIPPVIWLALNLMALLAMVVMGYQAGLTGTRSRLATWTLAITFSSVMALVTDLDRPRMSLFTLNQQTMYEYQENIHRHMEKYAPAGTRDR